MAMVKTPISLDGLSISWKIPSIKEWIPWLLFHGKHEIYGKLGGTPMTQSSRYVFLCPEIVDRKMMINHVVEWGMFIRRKKNI